MRGIDAFLLPGERLIWQGRPRQGLRLAWRDLFLIPFSLIWAGAAFAMVGPLFLSSLQGGAPAIIGGLSLIFLVGGAYAVLGRFLHDAWVRGRTAYGLTEQRALIVRGGSVSSLPLRNVHLLNLTGGKRGGRGTIQFGRTSFAFLWPLHFGFGLWVPSLEPTPRFIGIERARWVFDQILIAKGKTPPA